jgi:hypothetical protein
MPQAGRRYGRGTLTSAALSAALLAAAGRPAAAQDIPPRLTDSTFWAMVTSFSEPGGYFRSDNLVSNEAAFQYVIPGLRRTIGPGGVYLGVGPDQNFTYLAAFTPRIAFIVDIRRGALLQHLMYKALLELSPDRVEFASKLFSRRRPSNLDTAVTPQALFAAYAAIPPDSLLYRNTLEAMRSLLLERHGFPLTKDDLDGIEYVFSAFHEAGPDLTYNFGGGVGGARGFSGFGMPSYSQLQSETDGQGRQHSYMASEANYRVLRDLEMRNLVVPLVGDFAGPRTLRAVGDYLRQHRAAVSVFYTSNVEQYLFQQGDDWSRFYENVAALPFDTTSRFIRSLSNRGWVTSQNPNSRSAQLVASIAELVAAFRAGQIQSYYDVIQRSRQH